MAGKPLKRVRGSTLGEQVAAQQQTDPASLIPVNYLTKQREEYKSLLPDLLVHIEAGYLDDIMRPMVRAFYARRDVLKGTSTVVPDPDPASVVSDPVPPTHSSLPPGVSPYVDRRKDPANYPDLTFRADISELRQVPMTPYVSNLEEREGNERYFSHMGKKWSKASIEARIITIQGTVWDGALVEVSNVAQVKFTGELLAWPKKLNATPKAWRNIQAAREGRTLTFPVSPYLDPYCI